MNENVTFSNLEKEKTAFSFMYEHPAFVGTLALICINLIGLVSSVTVFTYFGLNYFDFAEIDDFLISAFKRISALVISMLMVLIAAAIFLYKVRKSTLRPRYLFVLLLWSTMVACVPAYLTSVYAIENVWLGDASVYDVRFVQERNVPPEQQTQKPEVIRGSVIGRPSDFMIFYVLHDCSVRLIPKTSVRSMTFVDNKKNYFRINLFPTKRPEQCQTALWQPTEKPRSPTPASG
jgi:hypothetical protein